MNKAYIITHKPEILLFAGIVLFFLAQLIFVVDPVPHGDGHEYMLMMESLLNHGTPALKVIDLHTFKAMISRYQEWQTYSKHWLPGELMPFLLQERKLHDFKLGYMALRNKQGRTRFLSTHFWGYSLAAIPVRLILQLLGVDERFTFQVFNVLLVLLLLAYLFFLSPLPRSFTLWFGVAFCLSPVYWYISWPHPETYTAVLTALALVFVFEKRFHPAVLCASLAATQNLPLVLLAGCILLIALVERPRLKRLLTLSLCLLPMLLSLGYFQLNFGTPSAIATFDGTSLKFLTLDRYISFFIDLNQGLIIAMPVMLLAFVIFYLADSVRAFRRRDPRWLLGLVFYLMIALCIQTLNFNMGQNYVVRYAAWLAVIPLAYVIFFLNREKKLVKALLVLFLVSQLYLAGYSRAMSNRAKFMNCEHKKWTRWLLRHYPQCYNPIPEIFIERTTHIDGYSHWHEPVIFYDKQGNLAKAAVSAQHRDRVTVPGMSQKRLAAIAATRRAREGWIYIHARDLDATADTGSPSPAN